MFTDLSVLELNHTVCKDFSDFVRSLFLIIKFPVYASHFHINLIDYSVVIRDLLGVFSVIINVYLALLCRGYNLLVNY